MNCQGLSTMRLACFIKWLRFIDKVLLVQLSFLGGLVPQGARRILGAIHPRARLQGFSVTERNEAHASTT